ncbi:MAG: polysaccharide pyruvyl transferase family protein [Arenicellales bacterium]
MRAPIVVFNPAIKDHSGTPNDNLGDVIIWRAIERHLRGLFGPSVKIASISSHVPPNESASRQIRDAEYRFVGGSNLLSSNMRRRRQWKVSGRVMAFRHRAILLGVGWTRYQDKPQAFTRFLLRSVLSHKANHSVRDGYTERQLRSAGFPNVINTSCPTLWDWAGEPRVINTQEPSDRVLLTLTDYRQDEKADRALVECLARRYREIIFWPQGSGDLRYGCHVLFNIRNRVHLLENTLDALDSLLVRPGSFDYIGTRLHGGIECLKSGRRGLIIGVDNRAREISRETGLPTVRREDLDAIEHWADNSEQCEVHIKKGPIERWMQQFDASDS